MDFEQLRKRAASGFDRPISITFFNNIKTSKRDTLTVAWKDLVQVLTEMVEVDDRDQQARLINLNKYRTEDDPEAEWDISDYTNERYLTKGKKNIVSVDGIFLDIDNEPDGTEEDKSRYDRSRQRLSYEDAVEVFKDFEYVIYPSWSHRQVVYEWNEGGWKKVKTDGDDGLDRFRIVVPFEQPCPFEIFERIEESLAEVFFNYAAPESFRASQIFYTPIWKKDEKQFNATHYNKGKALDWSGLKRKEIPVYDKKEIVRSDVIGGEGKILLDTLDIVSFLQDQGLQPKTGRSSWQECICPMGHTHSKDNKAAYYVGPDGWGFSCKHTSHGQFKRSEFVKHFGIEAFRPYCETEPVKTGEEVVSEFLSKMDKKRKEQYLDVDNTKSDVLDKIDTECVQPYNRKKRSELIERKCVKHNWNGSMLLFAFEGFGKSHYAYLEVKKNKKKVLFASLSNEQAEEQAESFRLAGLNVQFIAGRKYQLGKLGYECVMYKRRHPWDAGEVNKKETIELIAEQSDRAGDDAIEWATDIWDSCAPDLPKWHRYDVVVTTMARVNAWGQSLVLDEMEDSQKKGEVVGNKKGGVGLKELKNAFDSSLRETKLEERRDFILPRGTIIFFDDPAAEQLKMLAPYDKEYKEVKIRNRSLETVVVSEKMYFVRPSELTLTFGLEPYHLVFTTTEILTKHLIEKEHERIGRKLYQPVLMPERKMRAGDITMIKTDKVRSKVDGVLPVMMNRLLKEGFKFTYIADGQSQNVNLVNNKGQNQFADDDVIVEISMPHWNTVTDWLAELRWDGSERAIVELILVLDALHQAIGRNSGYRWVDKMTLNRKECIILCEPRMYKRINEYSRYHINEMIDDVMTYGSLNRTEYDEQLVDAIVWFLRNFNRYVVQGVGNERNAFINDIKDVMKSLKRGDKMFFTRRLETALKTLIKKADTTYKNRLSIAIGELSLLE